MPTRTKRVRAKRVKVKPEPVLLRESLKSGRLKGHSWFSTMGRYIQIEPKPQRVLQLWRLAIARGWIRNQELAHALMQVRLLENRTAKPPKLSAEDQKRHAERVKEILNSREEPKQAPQTAKPKEVDPDKPRNEYLDHLCLLPPAPAYLDEFSEEKFKRLLREGHRTFQYLLPDGRIVDEDMHDCQKTKTDDLIPKIKVCQQPEWRMVLRIEDGELKWFSRKDAPKLPIEAFGGAKFCNFIPELFGIDTWR